VVLDGEIYNFVGLRDELRSRDHRFSTRCDTEVTAHLAEELDAVELARRLDRMFAFAVWDARRERVILGCDRVGKKPLLLVARNAAGVRIGDQGGAEQSVGAARAQRAGDSGVHGVRIRPYSGDLLRGNTKLAAGSRADPGAGWGAVYRVLLVPDDGS
jgi:asparagine synthetase B (glutamine-hydrolysing)